MKKLAIFLICFFPLALLFCVFTLRFKPDGTLYFTFLTHVPVIVAGDGSSYQTAYQLRHGQAAALTTIEIETIRDRYPVAPDTLIFTSTNLNSHAYDIISFTLPTGTNTVYFDVSAYKTKNDR